jgi:gas vesicle protein
MNHIAGGMKSLCEDIATGRGDRKTTLQQLKGDADAIRDNARKFLAESKKFHKETSKDLKKGLREGREDLMKNVNALREDFKKKEKEVRADLAEANRIWNKMRGTLRGRKTKPEWTSEVRQND